MAHGDILAPGAAAQLDAPLSIFLSCTSVDLGAYRDRVAQLVEAWEQHAIVMDHFALSHDGDGPSISLEKVAPADLYVLLLAWRYGHVPSGQDLSVTHQEYREARRLNKPCLIFLADPETAADGGPGALFPAGVRDPQNLAQLEAFRAEVQEHLVGFFTTPEDLADRLGAALNRFLLRRQRETLLRERGLPFTLPPVVPDFVGRATELDILRGHLRLRGSESMAFLVTGMAGVGKSALAARVVRELATDNDAFPGGLTWIRCTGQRGLAGLLSLYDQILAAWGEVETLASTSRDIELAIQLALRENALKDRLQQRDSRVPPQAALVLLDNVERDFPLERALECLLPLGVSCLVTSRYEFALPWLRLLRLGALDEHAAVQLFRQRFAAREGTWDESRDRAAALAVVSALGYLPLAIELAAARAALRHISVNELSHDLHEAGRLGLLGDPTDSTRSVSYAFMQSFAELPPTERACFTAIGVLQGDDWAREIADDMFQGIAGGQDATIDESASLPKAVPNVLDTLTAYSLVQVVDARDLANGFPGAHSSPPPRTRVRIHALLRDYAGGAFTDEPLQLQRTAIAALMSSVARFVERHSDDSKILGQESDCMLGAALLALDKQLAQRSVLTAMDALSRRYASSHSSHAYQIYQLRLRAAHDIGDHSEEWNALHALGHFVENRGRLGEAKTYYERALPILGDVEDNAEFVALLHLGELAYQTGDFREAVTRFESALALARAEGDLVNIGVTLSRLESVVRKEGVPDAGAQYHREALAIADELYRSNYNGADLLVQMGNQAKDRHDLEVAMAYLREALTVAKDRGSHQAEVDALHLLGHCAEEMRSGKEALSYFEQALTKLREYGASPSAQFTLLKDVIEVAQEFNEPRVAERYYGQVTALAAKGIDSLEESLPETTDRQATSWIDAYLDLANVADAERDSNQQLINLHLLGHEAEGLGRIDEARRLFEQALILAERIDDLPMVGRLLVDIGSRALSVGQHDEAAAYYERAVQVINEVDYVASEYTIFANLAEFAIGLDKWAEALDLYNQALDRVHASGNQQEEVSILERLARRCQERGDIEETFRYFERDVTVRQALGDRIGAAAVLGYLYKLATDRPDDQRALRYLEQDVPIKEALQQYVEVVADFYGIATLAKKLGQDEVAAGAIQSAQIYAESIEDAATRAEWLDYLGMLILNQDGDTSMAVRCCRKAVDLLRGLPDREHLANALLDLGISLRHAEATGEAVIILQESLVLAKEDGDGKLEALVQHQLGHVMEDEGDQISAKSHFWQANLVGRASGKMDTVGRALYDLSRIARDEGDLAEAIALAEEAHGVLESEDDREYDTRVQAYLETLKTQQAGDGLDAGTSHGVRNEMLYDFLCS